LTSERRVGKVTRIVVRFLKGLLVGALLVAPPTVAGEAERPRSVLVLYGFDPFAPVMVALDTGLRATLHRQGTTEITVHNEVLDPEALVDPLLAPKQRAWFQARYGVYRPDAVVAVGEGALTFALSQQNELWPGVPLVYSAIDDWVVALKSLPPGVTGVARRPAIRQTLELALQLLPGTEHVAFVGGTSPVDRAYDALARPEVRRVAGHLEQIDLTGLSLAETEQRIAVLPDHTIVFGVSLFRDGTGRSVRGTELVQVLARRSNAPLFSTHAVVVGLGVVGGWVSDFGELGRLTGELVRSVIERAPGSALPAPVVAAVRPMVDARQLERWHIPESRLPPGTEVLFRETSVWRRYRGTIIAVACALLVESFLIAFLLVERRRRRAAEAEARANQERIAHINRVGTIAELSGSLAHELNGPLGAIVNNARAARKFLLREDPDLKEVRASLVDIEGSAERAGQVIRRLRSVLRKDEFHPVRVDVAAVVHDAVRLVQSEAARRRVAVMVDLAPELPPVNGDEVLLLQVLLNLLLNALDAVGNQPPAQRQVAVRVATQGGAVEVVVLDSGPGIPPSALEGVFEPFFTTKPQGLGMGLAICRSITEAHGGRISAENRSPGGAAFRLTLPVVPLGHEAAA
jgi:signal transduction histidine kinase